MSAAELKNKKPTYPENINGTHCMGDHWTVCCPNRHLQYNRYQQTKEVVQVYYNGGIYRVFVCTAKCSHDLKTIAKNNPAQFKKLFIIFENRGNRGNLLKNAILYYLLYKHIKV